MFHHHDLLDLIIFPQEKRREMTNQTRYVVDFIANIILIIMILIALFNVMLKRTK